MVSFRKLCALALAGAMLLALCACGTSDGTAAAATASPAESAAPAAAAQSADLSALAFDSAAWNYDADNDVYWQIGVVYCSAPQADEYESLGIYVPGAYMNASANGDGTYTCTVNASASVGTYTAATAPIVMPVNTAGYAAQAAPTAYSSDGLSDYLEAGIVYVYAGCRGRNNGTNADGSAYDGGAPWGVTDLKAAVRYLRLNAEVLPGDTDRIFTFGHSGGGAQSALMGATGDSELYYAYLDDIGAALYDADGNYISDAVCGAMCWCPITSLDAADEAYEWMMGQYSDSGTRADDTWTGALSDDLAASFADYVNGLGLTDGNGNALTLTATDGTIYTAGTYYDYMLSVIEQSLNNFLADTAFPYTSGGSTAMADGGFAGGGISGTRPSGGGTPPSGAPSGDAPGALPSGGSGASSESVTYETAQDYIDALNGDDAWITYDAAANTAEITSIGAFVTHCKNASKDVCAFDALDRSQAENYVFGNGESDALHFDAVLSALLSENADKYAALSGYDASCAAAYAGDLTNTDALGTDSATRQNMYNPLYFLSAAYAGCGSSVPAKYWRINTGIDQGDTSLSTEMDLALVLAQNSAVDSVDFTTVWGQGHTTAERTGDSTSNFIAWVESCCAA